MSKTKLLTNGLNRDTSVGDLAADVCGSTGLPRRTVSTPKLSPKKVVIANPMPGGSHYTSRKQADRMVYVRRIARYDERGRLVFLNNDISRILDAELRLREKRYRLDRNYDAIKRAMTLEEIRHIPVVHPERLVTERRRRSQ